MQCRRMPPLAGWGTMKVRRPMSIGARNRHRSEKQGNAAGLGLTRLAGIVILCTLYSLVRFPGGFRHGNYMCSSRQSGSGSVVPLCDAECVRHAFLLGEGQDLKARWRFARARGDF